MRVYDGLTDIVVLSHPITARYSPAMNASALQTPARRKLGLQVEDFLLLAEHGAFAGYDRKVELIDGDIYVMSPLHSRHARAHSRLLVLLSNALADLASDLEALEVSARVADDSAPTPDIVLTDYRGQGVVPADDIALAVEVSDTSLDVDLGRKAEIYAAAGIKEYWVVDCAGARIVVHEQPGKDGYALRSEVPFGDPMASATIAGLAIDTTRLRD